MAAKSAHITPPLEKYGFDDRDLAERLSAQCNMKSFSAIGNQGREIQTLIELMQSQGE